MADNRANNFLAHYGIKGMRWGRRKARVETAPQGPRPKASEDARSAHSYQARVRAGGVDALSTKELQALVNRQNLEQQYARLNPQPVSAGQKFLSETLPSVGKLGYSVYRMYKPAPEPPMSTEARRTSGKQMVGDMLLTFGKEVAKEHGLTVGKMILESMLK